jgi:hypothetical protein
MYRTLITQSSLQAPLAAGLISHLESDIVPDVVIDYKLPPRAKLELPRHIKQLYPLTIKSIRLPARLNNPIIPYTAEILNYISTGNEKDGVLIHDHHHSDLKALKETMLKINIPADIKAKPISHDINLLKSTAKASFSRRTNAINLSALAFAKRATKHDLSIAALTEINFQPIPDAHSPYMSFLICIHRLRSFLVRLSGLTKVKADSELKFGHEAELILFDNFTYCYGAKDELYEFYLIVANGHFRMYHSSNKEWYVGTSNHLDYMFTVADILNNLDLIVSCEEYSWAKDFFNLMIELSTSKIEHNLIVKFMKSLEGFLLNLSDYDENYAMNWRPLMDAACDLWEADKIISSIDYDFKWIPCLIHNPKLKYQFKSILLNIIVSVMNLEREKIQELSSLHKLMFYAEINEDAGMEKFLKRVHTKRPCEIEPVKNITRLAKRLFLLSYRSKHGVIPNLLGLPKKLTLLKIYGAKNEVKIIESLPLPWWDDIEIFDCMDNTLTEDALEFAKDKGALKKEVRFGPGDSRKELLQVIEQEDYTLKEFFKDAPFLPKIPCVYDTNHSSVPFLSRHPVRAIPKEREQKDEGRLFANGELSDKHALSLVTTQMKKALSYFDEQLMTPADKIRKEILHEAAQDLMQPDNYSLLLDIEGHNQSMQAHNTSELIEFVGMLFGHRGWGTLPDYFSQLDVYHYSEYINKVTLSNGQLGGIEGWLNPLWTLHTTLMMKLLRTMTDIVIPKIMVYSDDVNALIEIKQASENTVQSVFNKIISHCYKFGMIVKFSQTNLSKHRVTMLRQHYADGVRADSTLKKLISTSGANNPMLMSEEIEISGICSSIASALEMSNHSETCAYLKNYKIGLLVARLPHILLSHPQENSMLSTLSLPSKLVNLLYNIKDNTSSIIGNDMKNTIIAAKNDIANYLEQRPNNLSTALLSNCLGELYGTSITEEKFADNPDRLLYLQIYDEFLQDLLFFWIYLPASLGGLGGILHIDLILSGHSSGLSKSTHYLYTWIKNYSSNKSYFYKYLSTTLDIDDTKEINFAETRVLTSTWPSDMTVTTANTSVNQAIKSMIQARTKNKEVLLLFKLQEELPNLQIDLIEIFRKNFHPRIAQFYYENTSSHFIDLLVNKIETSSGLLSFIRSIPNLRNSLAHRMMDNLRIGSKLGRRTYGTIDDNTDVVEFLIKRRSLMFPKIEFIEVDEILYDDKLEEIQSGRAMITVRKCSPMHYVNGIKVYDMPKVGNEVRYKGEIQDDDRMLGNKEEFMSAKLVAVTKWFITKGRNVVTHKPESTPYDCVLACNLSLKTLTGQTFIELYNYSPNETGGEILHRIPNLRFSTSTYLRSEMNRSLTYTTDLNQSVITEMDLIDSNVNFDYLRLRILLAMVIRDKYPQHKRLVARYVFSNLIGIHDVQFVSPKITTHRVKNTYTCYGSFRNHKFSHIRFRYMASFYLNIDDMNDLALIPSGLESATKTQLGVDLINELIYRYAQNLDRDYMSIIPEYIDVNLWKPLINKLISLDPTMSTMNDNRMLIYIKDHLIDIMHKRKRITVLSRAEPLKLSMQNQCLESLKLYAPRDNIYTELVKSLMATNLGAGMHQNLNRRMAKYQNDLLRLENHKLSLTVNLICQYIIFFHFLTTEDASTMHFDSRKSYASMIEIGIARLSVSLICPEIELQMMILGYEYVERISVVRRDKIEEILDEISEDNILADI